MLFFARINLTTPLNQAFSERQKSCEYFNKIFQSISASEGL